MFVVEEENVKANRFRQSNIYKKMGFVLDGVHASLDDFSVRLAFYISVPLSLIFFILNPNIITKIVGLLVFSFWIIFETINTSIESVVDRIGPEIHPLSKIAKDTAAVPPAIMIFIWYWVSNHKYAIISGLSVLKLSNCGGVQGVLVNLRIVKVGPLLVISFVYVAFTLLPSGKLASKIGWE